MSLERKQIERLELEIKQNRHEYEKQIMLLKGSEPAESKAPESPVKKLVETQTPLRISVEQESGKCVGHCHEQIESKDKIIEQLQESLRSGENQIEAKNKEILRIKMAHDDLQSRFKSSGSQPASQTEKLGHKRRHLLNNLQELNH